MSLAAKSLLPVLASAALLCQSLPSRADPPFKDFTNETPRIDLPGLNEYAPATRDANKAAGFRAIRMDARLSEKGQPIDRGLVWRVFYPTPGADGKLPLLATAKGGSATFQFEAGDYLVNVAFGKASVTRKVTVPKVGPVPEQSLVLNAGGLRLNAVSGNDVTIPAEKLRFSIYTSDEKDGKRALVATKVKPSTVVRLNAGTYHVVSDYGKVNAIIGADIRVQAGKLTEATIQHRAAQMTLKLVSAPGGEAIADTAWSILTSAGDIVSESVGAFPSIVLAEGKYTAVARNKGHIYQRDFDVTPGRNQDVEVLLQ